MKLVFVTQVIDGNDAVLGFVVRWVQGLAKVCDRVTVIALEKGDVSALPGNVDVKVIGREGKLKRYLLYRKHLKSCFKQGFDGLLTHMVPRYSNLASGLAKRHKVRHALWYTHAGVDDELRKAVARVDKVFTASARSLRVATPKRVVTGHGVDIAHFQTDGLPADPPQLLSVGRMTPSKDPLTIMNALMQLRGLGYDLHLAWVGGALAEGDEEFGEQVRQFVDTSGLAPFVKLHGAVPYSQISPYYERASIFVSASQTGSLDKAVLEAMAAGRLVVTCNDSFPDIFTELKGDKDKLIFPSGDADSLAERIEALLAMSPVERTRLTRKLQEIVKRDHEVDQLMVRMVLEMGGKPKRSIRDVVGRRGSSLRA